MGVYTSPSYPQKPTSTERKWNPFKILGIMSTDPDHKSMTCIGYAPSKKKDYRCGNPINKTNRFLIKQTLDEISYWSPSDPAVISRLRGIAGLALCIRNHQCQKEAVLGKWELRIRELEDVLGGGDHDKPCKEKLKKKGNSDCGARSKDKDIQEMRDILLSLEKKLAEMQADRAGKASEEAKRRQRDERERKEREREERERKERESEEQRRRVREQAARNERVRQRAQKIREECERKKREEAKKERDTREQLWADYQDQWEKFTACESRVGNIGDTIPWPVKGGLKEHVNMSAVQKFMQMALPSDANVSKIMRKESRKWHPDAVKRWLRDSELPQADQERVDMICRVVTDILNKAARRASEFRD